MSKNPGLLSAPVRVFWELGLKSGVSRERAFRTAEELIALKVFYVTIRPADGQSARLAAELIEKSSRFAHITLSVASPDAFPGQGKTVGIKALDIYNFPAGRLQESTTILKNAPAGVALSVTAVPEKGKLDGLLEIIREGLALGIKIFSLANPNLVNIHCSGADKPVPPSPSGGEAVSRFILGKSDREYLKRGLEALFAPHGDEARLLVHDLFLHEALNLPGLGRAEYAGCQAGDAIAFIAADGTVYPCATLPLPLGNINGESLKDIWAGAARRKLRAEIEALPGVCAACGLSARCLGACRGLAFASGGFGLPDPSCGRDEQSGGSVPGEKAS